MKRYTFETITLSRVINNNQLIAHTIIPAEESSIKHVLNREKRQKTIDDKGLRKEQKGIN